MELVSKHFDTPTYTHIIIATVTSRLYRTQYTMADSVLNLPDIMPKCVTSFLVSTSSPINLQTVQMSKVPCLSQWSICYCHGQVAKGNVHFYVVNSSISNASFRRAVITDLTEVLYLAYYCRTGVEVRSHGVLLCFRSWNEVTQHAVVVQR
jgi:hypothetical protein